MSALHHSIEDGEQFAYTGSEGDLPGLASHQRPLVQVSEHRIVPAADQRSHVEDDPHTGAAAPDGPLTSHLSAVPVDGSHPLRAIARNLAMAKNTAKKYASAESPPTKKLSAKERAKAEARAGSPTSSN